MSHKHLPVLVLASASALALAALPTEETPTTPSPAVGGALAWADFDGDGLRDVYVANPAGEDHLFRGLANGRFEDVTEIAGLAGVTGTSVARWADTDGDGFPELFLAARAGSRLLKNDGDGIFRAVTERVGLSASLFATDGAWLDYDGDGAMDLAVATVAGEVLYHNAGAGLFEEVSLDVTRTVATLDTRALDDAGSTDSGPSAGGRPGATGSGGPGGPGTIPPADRNGGGTNAPVAPPRGGSAPMPPPAPAPPGSWCPAGVDDFSNPGTCLPASTVPQTGYLYPLGSEFYIDSATGNVGINKTNPVATLHVDGPAGTDPLRIQANGATKLLVNDDGQTEIGYRFDQLGLGVGAKLALTASGTSTDDAFRIYEANGVFPTVNYDMRFRVTSDGHVSLGDSASHSSEFTLNVIGEETVGSMMVAPGGGANNSSELWMSEDDGGFYRMGMRYDGSINQLQFVSTNDGGVTEFGPWLTIERDEGRVGIHTPNPNAAFGVKQTADGGATLIRGLDLSDTTVFRVLATGRTVTTAVEITGGGDLVEGFETSEGEVEAGTVMSIDPVNPGQLTTSVEAYDAKVAGVVSGAGGINHGLRMGQDGVLDGDTLVAMTGRVYVKCSAENGAIVPGDRLTTAKLAGHAMRATDSLRSDGAVLGKAMTGLDKGTGLVLVLVNLQ